ncbi:hypothetical protein OWM07_03040 [Deferribacter thermophilus]|uniref:hypothetical protein n=1 Tax=Deferribacter thermophilus TaxID=53573 RepID=UPI003C160D24
MNKILNIVFVILISSRLFAFDYQIDDNSLNFQFKVNKDVKLISKVVEENKIIFKLDHEINEVINKEFLGIPVSSIKVYNDKGEGYLEIEFVENILDTNVNFQNGFLIGKVNFVKNVNQLKGGVTSPYLRIIISLAFIIVLILILYKIIAKIYRRKINDSIPGVGSVLGRLDIYPGVTLFFVDFENYLYVLSYTNNGVNLIDKIVDENEMVRLRTGFAKKKDFSSYLKFFGKNLTKDEVEVTKTIVKEKVESLRKR